MSLSVLALFHQTSFTLSDHALIPSCPSVSVIRSAPASPFPGPAPQQSTRELSSWSSAASLLTVAVDRYSVCQPARTISAAVLLASQGPPPGLDCHLVSVHSPHVPQLHSQLVRISLRAVPSASDWGSILPLCFQDLALWLYHPLGLPSDCTISQSVSKQGLVL